MNFDPQRVKVILTYDILAETQDRYYQFMLGEMVPTAQTLGLQMSGAWHTTFGEYPIRLVEFIADDWETAQAALEHQTWQRLESKLQPLVTNYYRKIVRLREGVFQF